jgi:hypothetical protein
MSRDRTDLQVLFTHIVADRSARLVSEQRRVVSADLCRSIAFVCSPQPDRLDVESSPIVATKVAAASPPMPGTTRK